MPGFVGCLLAGSEWNWFCSKNKFEKLVHLVGFIKKKKLTLTLDGQWSVPHPGRFIPG